MMKLILKQFSGRRLDLTLCEHLPDKWCRISSANALVGSFCDALSTFGTLQWNVL